MVRSILVGLDGSPGSTTAAELGIRWARTHNAQLAGLAVVDQPGICRHEPTGIGGSSFKKHRDEHLLADANCRVDEFLKQFAARCPADVVYRSIKAVGHPYKQILVEAEPFDIVLLSQQPQFHFKTRTRDTDTIRKVVLSSPHPVVIVPERLPESESVLVAYDGSPASGRALQAFVASSLNKANDICVATVRPTRVDAERQAERGLEFLRHHNTPASSLAIESKSGPAQILLDQVRQLNMGMLVMGAYGRSRLHEFLCGSTTRALFRESPVPIFTSH
jgi:nucleotide-binding universal stress UspA family protein